MAILIFAALAVIFAFVYGIFASASTEAVHSQRAKSLLLFLFVTGAALCIGSAVIFFLMPVANKVSAQELGVARDSFLMFLGTDLAFVAVGGLVSLAAVLLKSRFSALVNVIMPMWAIISLFWAYVCGIWSVYSGVNVSIYIYAFAAGGAGLLALPSQIALSGRYKVLSDKESRLMLIRARNEKKQKRTLAAEQRRNLRRKKQMLKNGKTK